MLVLLHSATVLFWLALSVFCRGWLNFKCYAPITLSELFLQSWPAVDAKCQSVLWLSLHFLPYQPQSVKQIKRNTGKYHLTRTTAIWGFRKKICESMFFHHLHIRLHIVKANNKKGRKTKDPTAFILALKLIIHFNSYLPVGIHCSWVWLIVQMCMYIEPCNGLVSLPVYAFLPYTRCSLDRLLINYNSNQVKHEQEWINHLNVLVTLKSYNG